MTPATQRLLEAAEAMEDDCLCSECKRQQNRLDEAIAALEADAVHACARKLAIDLVSGNYVAALPERTKP